MCFLQGVHLENDRKTVENKGMTKDTSDKPKETGSEKINEHGIQGKKKRFSKKEFYMGRKSKP